MEQTNNKTLILEKLSQFLPLSLAFLMPLFLLPTTTEFFEFNKLALLTVVTVLLMGIVAIKILTGEKIRFVKSIVDLPMWAFGLVVILATIFSIDKTSSIYGSHGRWFPSLFSFLAILAYYYFSASVYKSKKIVETAVYLLLGAFGISTTVAILNYFKIHISASPYMQIPGFTLAGSITTTAIFAAISIILAVAMLAYESKAPTKLALVVLSSISFFYLTLANTLPAWFVLGAGIVGVLSFVNLNKFNDKKPSLVMLGGFVLAVLTVVMTPTVKGSVINENYPKELSLSLRESWIISSSIARDYPVLGTGPGTFKLNFTRYRPMSLNASDTWNVRFDKPYNEGFNVVSNLGIVGFLAGLYFTSKLIALIKSTKNLDDDSGIANVVSIGLIGISSTFLVTYATVLTSFVFVFLLGLLVATNALLRNRERVSEVVTMEFASVSAISSLGGGDKGQESYAKYIISVPLLLLTGYFGYLNYENYMAEVYMRQAVLAAPTDGVRAYELQGKAINLNPQRDIYHSAYAQTNLALANVFASRQELSENDKRTVQELIAQSIRSTRNATEIVNPLNVANWEIRAAIYRNLINVAENSGEWAIASYDAAIQLDPTNPRLRVDLGGVYFTKEDYLSAANQFRQATALKSDYANAYYNFAQALIQLEDFQNAKAALEITKGLIPLASDDYKRIEEELAVINELPQVAGAASEKPTVEELAGPDTTPGTTESQEPLTTAGETETSEEVIDMNSLPPREQDLVEDTSTEEVIPEEPEEDQE